MKTYTGYVNYYVGGVLKSYQFNQVSRGEAMMTIDLMRMKGKPYVGYLAVEQTWMDGKIEKEQIVIL